MQQLVTVHCKIHEAGFDGTNRTLTKVRKVLAKRQTHESSILASNEEHAHLPLIAQQWSKFKDNGRT
jgi:hypothetical protein